MALDQSALLEVLDALKVADVGDRVRQAAETVYQALIEAELTETIGAAPHQRTDERTAQRNGHLLVGRGPGRPGPQRRARLVVGRPGRRPGPRRPRRAGGPQGPARRQLLRTDPPQHQP